MTMNKYVLNLQVAVSSGVLLVSSVYAAPPGSHPSTQGTNAVVGRSPAGQRIGTLEEAKKIIGSDLKDTHSQSIGRIEDMVLDLESGRVLYSIATLKGQNEHIALPATLLREHHTGKGQVLNADASKLSGAPKFGAD